MTDVVLNHCDSNEGDEKWLYLIHIVKVNHQWVAIVWGSEEERNQEETLGLGPEHLSEL